MVEINFVISFLSGVLTGISPCIFLISIVFGSSLVLSEKKEKFLSISLGLLSGILLAYLVMTLMFLFLFQFFGVLTFFRFIFTGILVFIGMWQIIEADKEKSLIFKTPLKVKLILKEFIEKKTVFFSFLVGLLFILIKLPCMGAVYSSLLYNLYSNPLLIFYIITYLGGMLTPAIIILILIRLNIESSRIEIFRLKYRPYLRIVNGLLLIILAIYLLFF